MQRRYFVHDEDWRSQSVAYDPAMAEAAYSSGYSLAKMWLDMGFREVPTRAEYLAFRREHQPAGEEHVWMSKEMRTKLRSVAKRTGVSVDRLICAGVATMLKQYAD